MDHSSHSHNHHNHMMSHNHDADLGSHLATAVLNTTLVSNVSAAVVAGLEGAAETVSQIAKNITDMGHNEHMNHQGGHMGAMNMGTTSMHMGGMDMGGMQMYFHFGYEETILFYGWKISTIGGLIGSMLGIFCIAVLYEGLKYIREFLFKKSLHRMQQVYSAANSKGAPNSAPCARSIPLQYMDEMLLPTTLGVLSSGHMVQTVLHMLQFVISYCLMLIFMTYNVWLCLACTLGAGCGYFLFGWKKSVVVDITEHCH